MRVQRLRQRAIRRPCPERLNLLIWCHIAATFEPGHLRRQRAQCTHISRIYHQALLMYLSRLLFERKVLCSLKRCSPASSALHQRTSPSLTLSRCCLLICIDIRPWLRWSWRERRGRDPGCLGGLIGARRHWRCRSPRTRIAGPGCSGAERRRPMTSSAGVVAEWITQRWLTQGRAGLG